MATERAPMTERETRQRAIARALTNGGACAVERVCFGTYRVESATRPGTIHTVGVDASGIYSCTCEAGLAGRVCWHQAAVYVAKVEHTSGGRVVAPAALVPPVVFAPVARPGALPVAA